MTEKQQVQIAKHPTKTPSFKSKTVGQTADFDPLQERLPSLLQRASSAAATISPADAARLQRTIGNRSVGHLATNHSLARSVEVHALSVPPMKSLQRMLANQPSLAPKGQTVARPSSLPKPTLTPMVVQRNYKYDDKTYEAGDYEKESFSDLKGSDGKFTAVNADHNLPTFYGVLKGVYGEDNLNLGVFAKTKDLGENLDRPRKVSARITKFSGKDLREGNPKVTAIGNLGNEELLIRDGMDVSRVTDYDGGHLIGYQILGGPDADQSWNVAPQDKKNNEFAYNNTIEQMLRSADPKTTYDYHVEVKYKSLNFRVDQKQLVEHGILKAFDKTKYWEIQLPARIPQHWEAKAVRVDSRGKFGLPAKEGKKEDTVPKTYEQFSQEMEEKLMHTDESHTARFNLSYEDLESKELKKETALDNLGQVGSVHFRMHQVQPDQIGEDFAPIDWDENKKAANFGSVKLDELTYQQVKKLKDDIRELLSKVDESEEEEDISFDLMEELETALSNIPPEDQAKRTLLFGVSLLEDELMFDEYAHWKNESERLDKRVEEDNSAMEEIQEAYKEIDLETFSEETPPEKLLASTRLLKRVGQKLTRIQTNKLDQKRGREITKERGSLVRKKIMKSKSEASATEYPLILKDYNYRKKLQTLTGSRQSQLANSMLSTEEAQRKIKAKFMSKHNM